MDSDDVFDVTTQQALESMVYAYARTVTRNRHLSGGDVTSLTQGQKDVLACFATLYGEVFGEGSAMDYIFLMDQSGTIGLTSQMSPDNRAGAAYHHPEGTLFTRRRLTAQGQEVVVSLVDSINGETTQYEVDTISFCLGFDDQISNGLKQKLEQYVASKTSYEAPVR